MSPTGRGAFPTRPVARLDSAIPVESVGVENRPYLWLPIGRGAFSAIGRGAFPNAPGCPSLILPLPVESVGLENRPYLSWPIGPSPVGRISHSSTLVSL